MCGKRCFFANVIAPYGYLAKYGRGSDNDTTNLLVSPKPIPKHLERQSIYSNIYYVV
jgi:hypothetical protein